VSVSGVSCKERGTAVFPPSSLSLPPSLPPPSLAHYWVGMRCEQSARNLLPSSGLALCLSLTVFSRARVIASRSISPSHHEPHSRSLSFPIFPLRPLLLLRSRFLLPRCCCLFHLLIQRHPLSTHKPQLSGRQATLRPNFLSLTLSPSYTFAPHISLLFLFHRHPPHCQTYPVLAY
jgi:hypothetical protein